jgi:hypothetical protein
MSQPALAPLIRYKACLNIYNEVLFFNNVSLCFKLRVVHGISPPRNY